MANVKDLRGVHAYAQIRMRLARRFRAGLINKKTKAELACESLLKRLGVDFIAQAAFLAPRSFYIVDTSTAHSFDKLRTP